MYTAMKSDLIRRKRPAVKNNNKNGGDLNERDQV